MSEHMQGEGGGTGQTLREVLEELYGQSRGNSASTSSEIPMFEDVPRALQETADRIRQEEVLRPAQEASEEARQQELRVTMRTDRHKPRRYWQKTKITGVNPMDMPGVTEITGKDPQDMPEGATHRAQVDEPIDLSRNVNQISASPEVRTFGGIFRAAEQEVDRVGQEGRKEAQVSRVQKRGPRHDRLYKSLNYWQRTKITGEDPLSVPEDTTHRGQEDKAIDHSGNGIKSSLNRQSVFHGAVGTVEEAAQPGSSDRSNAPEESRVRLGMRTSIDIFEASQRDYEESRGQEGLRRKRSRLPSNRQPSENGLEELSRKRARLPVNRQPSEDGLEERSRERALIATGEERSQSSERNA
ncbi:hypothetical protein DM02DRAFT_637103, partial [Periconia macrospinosa]